MDDGASITRLQKNQLISVEKSLYELTRKQRIQAYPVDLPFEDFWSKVGQLLQQLEVELSETIRKEGMTAKAQLQSKRLTTVRTRISDLTRMRLNAFAQHGILAHLISSSQIEGFSGGMLKKINWDKHDSAERVFYLGIEDNIEKYKKKVTWSGLLGIVEKKDEGDKIFDVHKPLNEFVDSAPDLGDVRTVINKTSDVAWEEPEFDEEDRIREIEAFPEFASSEAESSSKREILELKDDLITIKILKEISDPIITADGEEINFEKGDVGTISALIAETLIAAGIAEKSTNQTMEEFR